MGGFLSGDNRWPAGIPTLAIRPGRGMLGRLRGGEDGKERDCGWLSGEDGEERVTGNGSRICPLARDTMAVGRAGRFDRDALWGAGWRCTRWAELLFWDERERLGRSDGETEGV